MYDPSPRASECEPGERQQILISDKPVPMRIIPQVCGATSCSTLAHVRAQCVDHKWICDCVDLQLSIKGSEPTAADNSSDAGIDVDTDGHSKADEPSVNGCEARSTAA